jgi:hypothetical protein
LSCHLPTNSFTSSLAGSALRRTCEAKQQGSRPQ